MKPLRGILPIVAATFDEEGNVDYSSFERLVHHLINTGVQGVTLFGLATEFYKLTDYEKEKMMKIMLEHTSKSSNVAGIISITNHSFEVAVKEAKKAESNGADALMVLPPYFLGPSAESILNHLKAVAKSVSIPVIVQYAPNQTGVKIAPEVFYQLKKECPNACLVKVETQPPGRYISQLNNKEEAQIYTLVGYAGVQMPDVLQRGAAGIQPGCSFSEIYVHLWELYENNQHEEFHKLFMRLFPYISYWMQGVELIIKAEKVILQQRGIIASDYCRHPDYNLDKKELETIQEFMTEFEEYFSVNNTIMEGSL